MAEKTSQRAIRNPEITLSDYWVGRSEKRGKEICEEIANGVTPESARIASHGIEKKVKDQADAKGAEVAYALYCDMDPETDLHWKVDKGWDLIRRRVKTDVKHTAHPKGNLIWPINKIDKLPDRDFVVLVLVTGTLPNFTIRKWTSRYHFIEFHKVATGLERLTPGTFFMEQDDLWPMSTLDEAPDWALDALINDPSREKKRSSQSAGRPSDCFAAG